MTSFISPIAVAIERSRGKMPRLHRLLVVIVVSCGGFMPSAKVTPTVTSRLPIGGEIGAVGLANGALWRVNANGGLEEANGRLGVAGAQVLAIDAAGATSIIGIAGGAIVSTDGSHVMRFSGPDAHVVAAARDRVAIGTGVAVEVYDLA